MIDALVLVAAGIGVLILQVLPALVSIRLLGGSWLLAFALAPACGFGLAGVAAILAHGIGVRWGVLPYVVSAAAVVIIAGLLRHAGIRLPVTPVLQGRLMPRRTVPGAPVWLLGAAAVAIIPIARAARWRPDAVLERWDTLYHLSALQRIRETGAGSSLTLGSVSNTVGNVTPYPAAFHDLVSVVPWVPVPILLNGATLTLAVVPWALGIALLSRATHPGLPWAPFAGAILALLVPAAPLNEWIHLSPIPNLTGFATLPGFLAGTLALWRSVLGDDVSALPRTARGFISSTAGVGIIAWGGVGLTLVQPNVAVTALLIMAALTGADAVRTRRSAPLLIVIPLLLLVPVAVLAWTPLGSAVTEFVGGLQVPWWNALGEVTLGLWTVWPMSLGVAIALLWWPGLVRCLRGERRWLALAWAVLVVLYLDAAVDSPLNLSVLFYRGQDRLSMPLAMVSCVLAIAGLQVWRGAIRRGLTGASSGISGARRGAVAAVLVIAAVAVTLGSIPTRSDNAAKNLDPDYPGRGRFLQADERTEFARVASTLDSSSTMLASPFSGGAHMYALHGQQVRFPVAGTSLRHRDILVIHAAADAATDPHACAFLNRWGIRYVYQDRISYQYDSRFEPLDRDLTGIGPVLMRTSHSTLYEVNCDPGSGSTDYNPDDRT